MNRATILRLQDEANSAYNRVPQSEAASYLTAALLAEIALQLQVFNEKRAVDDREWSNQDDRFITPAIDLDARHEAMLDAAYEEHNLDETGTHAPNCRCSWCSADED